MKNKLKLIFATLLLVAFLIKFAFIIQDKPIWWDTSVYIGMAKYVATQGSSGLWEPLRPLVWPLILSLMLILNVSLIFFAKIFQLFFSLGSVYLVYLIGKKIWSDKEGKIAVLILLFTPVITFYEGVMLSEIPAVFFGLLSLYYFLKEENFLSGFIAGISFLTKFPMGLMLVGLLLANINSRKRLMSIATGFIIPLLFFFTFNYLFYNDAFLPLKDGVDVFGKSSWFYNEGLYYYLINLLKENVFFILALIGLIGIRRKEEIALALFFILPFFYFGHTTHKEVRFYILFLPFICLLTARGTRKISEYKYGRAILVLLLFVFIPFAYQKFTDYYNFRVDFDEKYYNLISNIGIEGKILVSDPRFVLFTNKKLDLLYYKDYDEAHVMNNLKNASFVVLNKCDFLCNDSAHCAVHKKMYKYLKENMKVQKKELKGDCEIILYD
ncbi:glycosyltransferase family 39 protein [archaeon]|nr:glycosyltransferase family 39 protein [archaeon]